MRNADDALRNLLRLHLTLAYKLKLLDIASDSDLDEFYSSSRNFSSDWGNSIEMFGRAAQEAKDRFCKQWIYSPHPLNSEVELSRVCPLKFINFALNGTENKTRKKFSELKKRLDDLSADMALSCKNPNSKNLLGKFDGLLADFCIEFLNPMHKYNPYKVHVSKLHRKESSCWITQSSLDPNLSAQYVRDRLGLWDYPGRDGEATVGDQLVYMKFKVRLSSKKCPTKFDKNFIDGHPEDVWLVRPSVKDLPNVRFSQFHHLDEIGCTENFGKTIDISSENYQEGEREFVLLAGRDVKLEWQCIKLMSGDPPKRYAYDDDHQIFFNAIRDRSSVLVGNKS